MRVLTIILLALLYFRAIGGDTTYNVVTVNGKKGLKNDQGVFVISPKYDEIGWSDGSSNPHNELIGYKESGKWGLINVNDQKMTSAKYSDLFHFKNKSCIASIGGRFSQRAYFGLISEKGNPIIDFKYYSLERINGYLKALTKSDHQLVYGLINEQGQQVLKFKYKTIDKISDHLIKSELAYNSYTLFNTTTGNLIEGDFSAITKFDNEYSFIRKKHRIGLLNHNGRIVVEPIYEEIKKNVSNEWVGKKMTKWSVLDNSNKLIKELECQEIQFLDNRLMISTLIGDELLSRKFSYETPKAFEKIIKVSGSKVLYKNGDDYGVFDLNTSDYLKSLKFDTAYVSDQFIYGARMTHNKLKWALYDTFGIRRTHFDYDVIEAYEDRLFAVKRRNHWGFIDRKGNEVIHCVYEKVGKFNGDLVVVRYHGQNGVINKSNDWIVLPQDDEITLIDTETYLSQDGTSTKLLTFDGGLIYFTDNQITVKNKVLLEIFSDGRKQLISLEGTFVNNKIWSIDQRAYDNMKYIDDELIAILRNGKYGFIDRSNVLHITNRYDDVGRYNKNGTPVKLLGKWGMINSEEEITVQPTYDSISEPLKGVSVVKLDNMFGLINQSGVELLRPEYAEIKRLGNGEYLVKKHNKYGLADHKGRLLIDAKYDELDRLNNNTVIVKKRRLFGTLTLLGVEIIPNIYDKIYYHKNWQLFFAKQAGSWESISL